MITVLTCIGTQHDLRLVAIALVICCSGAVATMRLFSLATASSGLIKHSWIYLAAAISGSTIWCTHFVSVLAYLPGAHITYDPLLTMQSLIVAIVGSDLCLVIAGLEGSRLAPAIGGAVMGGTTAVMHYMGLSAFRVSGVALWHPQMVVVSVCLAVLLGALAFAAARGQGGLRLERYAFALFVAAIVSLHFTGMAALEIIPFSLSAQASDASLAPLQIATGMIGFLVFGIGGFTNLLDNTLRRENRAKLASLRLTDPLTGLANQEGLDEHLIRRLAAAGSDQKLVVAVMKFDNYADIVGRYGNRIGDLAIQGMAARIFSPSRPEIFVARTGRAEFTAIAPAPEEKAMPSHLEGSRSALAVPLVIELTEIALDVRIGVSCFPKDANLPEDLLRCARLALSRTLGDPLEQVAIYDEIQDSAASRGRMLASDLRGALMRGEFEVYYQPQVWIADRRVIGQEALIRWRHPTLGLVSPAEFIPLAERTGDILPIGLWVLETACAEALHWPNDWRVAVNVSPLQLRQPDLPERMHEILLRSGLSPDRLEIELTESLLLEDRSRALHVLRRIRALGVRLALDDFGTGYSSLDVLRHFPFDKIKLDKSFVDDVEKSPQSLAILHAVLAMGRGLDIPVLVEGVETEFQLAILQAEGCNKVQGYLTGRPVPASQIIRERLLPLEVLPCVAQSAAGRRSAAN